MGLSKDLPKEARIKTLRISGESEGDDGDEALVVDLIADRLVCEHRLDDEGRRHLNYHDRLEIIVGAYESEKDDIRDMILREG